MFEELDNTIKEIGGVSEFDMTYFTHLADAYLYAGRFNRSSGFRHEIGIAPIAGFYQLNYHLPKSYAIQHTVNASVISGIHLDIIEDQINENFMTVISAGYKLGLYPTTRTNINLSAVVGSDIVNESIGLKLGGDGTVYSDLNTFIYSNYLSGSRLSGRVGLTYALF